MPIDRSNLALAIDECACQITDWVHHFLIPIWVSLSPILMGWTIAFGLVGQKGWEPFVYNSGALRTGLICCFGASFIICNFGLSGKDDRDFLTFLVRPGNHMCTLAGCGAFGEQHEEFLLSQEDIAVIWASSTVKVMQKTFFCSWLRSLVLPFHLPSSDPFLETKRPAICGLE